MKRILVIRCGALGDLVYATSVIDAMKYQFGTDTIIDFVSTPGGAALFKKDNRVNRVFLLKHKKIPIFLSSQKKEIIKESKKNPYDILINFEFGKQFKSLILAVNAKKKVGALVQDLDIPKDVKHSVDVIKFMYKDIVDIDVFNKSFPRLIGSTNEEIKNKFNLPEKYLIISPSNSHQKRNILNYRAWENDSWKSLIKSLEDKIQIVIVGNKGEDEFFDKLKPYSSKVIDLVGLTPLVDLITIIKNAQGLVATDTGTAHIASSLNTDVFALIGPTPADVTGPYKTPNNKVHIISSNLACQPCYKTPVMKDCSDNICMKQITSKQVEEIIVKAIL